MNYTSSVPALTKDGNRSATKMQVILPKSTGPWWVHEDQRLRFLSDSQLADYVRYIRTNINESVLHEIFLDEWQSLKEPVALLCAKLRAGYHEILLRHVMRNPSERRHLREGERLDVIEQWLADYPPAAQAAQDMEAAE